LLRHTLLVAVLICAPAILAARQQPAASPPPQRLASGVAGIVVDAVVRDGRGNPVTDLRKEDFQLLEDGVPQQIGDVTVVMPGRVGTDQRMIAGTPAPSVDAASATAGKVTATGTGPAFLAIVFDRLSPEARLLSYKGALACLESLQPNDMVGIFLSDLTLTTIQSYTNNREKLRAAIKDVASRATSIFDRTATRNDLAGSDRGDIMPGDADPSVPIVASPESVGRPVDGRTLLIREIQAVQGDAWGVMARNQQGYATTNALLAITTALGTLPGRKTVVFFADGLAIPPAVLPHFQNVIATANRGNVSVYTIDAAGLRVHSKDAEIGREVRAMGAAGLAVGADGSNQSSLGMLERNEDVLRKDPRTSLTLLAAQTGGFLAENTNDLAKAFGQVDADRRFHYLITYAPKNSDFNGEWRNLVVKVPNRRVTVRARSGYLAVRAPRTAPLLAYEGPALAALERSPTPTDLPMRAMALVFPGGAKNRIAVVASTNAAALRFDRDDKTHTYRSDFTILARITDVHGEVVRQSSQPYRLSGPAAQVEQAQRGEVLFFRQPTLGPGTYTLEVAVHDALAMRSGVQRSTFVVPEAIPQSLQVSSLVLVQRTERVRPEERDKSNPLYAGDLLIYPNLGEPIAKSRQKTLAFYVVVVPGLGAATEASLEVLDGGRTISQAPVTLRADAPGPIAQVGELAVDTLTAGRYTLRLIVSQGGRREMRESAFVLIE
jgi:VWFA-related protein